ncbi:hypothetical protein H2248_011628 [Termitomyces sp. 'cryptogamus']|nr:hypothetical protein H2248_011628 [Termitomyces sp. 'cryptogamus']
MLRQLRALLRPLAIQAAYNPIETIVFFSIVGTLAYFHILTAIKHSAFFAPSRVPALRPTHLALHRDGWLAVHEQRDAAVLDIQQLVFGEPVAPALVAQLAAAASFSHLNASSLTLAVPSGTLAAVVAPLLPAAEFRVLHSRGAAEPVIGDTSSPKWMAYAFRALVMRFYTLAQMADSVDILLILLGYVLMHVTFYLLMSRSRALGSNFWLPAAIMSSSILALLVSVPIALGLGIAIDPVALTEALPFLVCTVGFDKPLRLARAVFLHPHLTTPPVALASLHAAQPMPLKPAAKILTESLSLTYPPVIRDYILEIAVLVVGAYSNVPGLTEVCALAALLLAVDCLLMCTYLVAVLGVMIEVRRIQTLHDRSRTRSRTNSVSSAHSTRSALVQPPPPPAWPERLLGVKGSLLGQKPRPAGPPTNPNPVARLKLLLIATFTTLHILNLITPLAPSAGPARQHHLHHTHSHGLLSSARVLAPRVDASDADVQTVLRMIATSPGDDELIVRVCAPLFIQPVPSTLSIPPSPAPSSDQRSLERFMDSWTRLVGDPIISKSIVVLLAISIMLNGYLIKGIAVGAGMGVGIGGAKALRFEPGAGAAVEPRDGTDEPKSRPRTRTFTLEDVDRRLRLGVRPNSPSIVHTPDTSTAVSTPSPPPPLQLHEADALKGIGTTRAYDDLARLYDAGEGMHEKAEVLAGMTDEEVVALVQRGKVQAYALEKVLSGGEVGWGVREREVRRAVRIRRAVLSRASNTQTLEHSLVPYENYDYTRVLGACCENVVGYIPIPLGIAGPLTIDGVSFPIPMATAEGTLVASTSRGCKALNASGGVRTVITKDGMTRGPAIDFPCIDEAARALSWIRGEGYADLKSAFESTSRFARLLDIKCVMAGRTVFARFVTATGDAMGMNMISKGTEKALEVLQGEFPAMVVLALSGNYCTDKKPAAVNWIEGRGKSVVAEAVVQGSVVKSVLKTTVEALCNLCVKKNLVGSAMAGSVGGFNAHAANILTAVFLATGQDPAQNVESSNCMTLMEPTNDGEDLLVTITMPSIEVGTVGGGTILSPQQGILEMLGIKGAHPTEPGANAQMLARIIAAAVMAGELSLLSALAAGHLIRAHMAHNRSAPATPASARGEGGLLVKAEAEVEAGVEEKTILRNVSTASLSSFSK